MPNLLPVTDRILSTSDIRRLVKRYWLTVVTVFLAGTLAMWAAIPIFFTDLYESQVRLLVKIGRENAETPASVQNSQVFSQGVRIADINSEVQILSSRSIVQKVVDRLGPDAFKSVLAPPKEWWGYPRYWAKRLAREVKSVYKEFLILAGLTKRLNPRDEAILAISKGVKVEPVRDSDILTLKVRTPGAQLSVDVLNAMLEEYFRSRTQARRNSAGSDFFTTRVEQAMARLDSLKSSRARVRREHDLSAPEQQRTRYLEELAALRAELVRNQAQVAQLAKQAQVMETRIDGLPNQVDKERVEGRNPALQPLIERLTELKLERAKISSRYLPGSEMVRKTDREIADLETALAGVHPMIVASVTTQTNPEKRGFEAGVGQHLVEIAGLETRIARLAGPIEQLQQRIREVTAAIDDLEGEDREYKRAENEYLLSAKRLDEARMSEALDANRVANVVAVEQPERPIVPAAPNKIFLMEVAMGVSLLLGLALAAFLEATDDRILDERNLTDVTGCAYLGTVQLREVA
jgi:uncharacterized protein involved in exopolysaccharide biosynthesis